MGPLNHKGKSYKRATHGYTFKVSLKSNPSHTQKRKFHINNT